MEVDFDYVSAGTNLYSNGAAWAQTGSLAYAAGQNIIVCRPGAPKYGSVVLLGHKSQVTTVHHAGEILVTGDVAGVVALWRKGSSSPLCLENAHTGSINAIASFDTIIATGAADGAIKVWHFSNDTLKLLTTIPKRFIPLSLAMAPFSPGSLDSAFLAAGGTKNEIYVYSLSKLLEETPELKLSATLTGHEGWITCLTAIAQPEGYLLATASQDKYTRLWRFQSAKGALLNGNSLTGGLMAKLQTVSNGTTTYNITFEALLFGHDDWVYSACWRPRSASDSPPELLTASADGSLSVWSPDTDTGIYLSTTRLGELSAQKGATTATGSSGAIYTALWSPDGQSIASLSRTGSWRLWHFDGTTQMWIQGTGISGHLGSVNGISWSPDGSYLLSTGQDQTTRLHAQLLAPPESKGMKFQWSTEAGDYINLPGGHPLPKQSKKGTWHEFSRPQIHGYDLNCIVAISDHHFASGADEKLLRVFDQPKEISQMLHRLCGSKPPQNKDSPSIASIPVLGLSNKSTNDAEEGTNPNDPSNEASNDDITTANPGADSSREVSLSNLTAPPSEDLLARHTLWPEHEKLYGHGSEIGACANNGKVLATACKASSLDQAVIRLYDTKTWHEVKPPLPAHTLTVTALAFSPDGRHLLSVGRDRAWTIFESEEGIRFKRLHFKEKAHSRMILDGCWLGKEGNLFATASRDKSIKVWSANDFQQRLSIAIGAPATAIAANNNILAVGADDGSISLHIIGKGEGAEVKVVGKFDVPRSLCPSLAITMLDWRPSQANGAQSQLAVASADGSVRILSVAV